MVCQCNEDALCLLCSGTNRAIRRKTYGGDTSVAQGISWQWEGDIPGQWHWYDVDIATELEKAHQTGQTSINLSAYQLPYTVNFMTMSQTRHHYGTLRKIQRLILPMKYPSVPSATLALGGSSSSSSSCSMSGSSGLVGGSPHIGTLTKSATVPAHTSLLPGAPGGSGHLLKSSTSPHVQNVALPPTSASVASFGTSMPLTKKHALGSGSYGNAAKRITRRTLRHLTSLSGSGFGPLPSGYMAPSSSSFR